MLLQTFQDSDGVERLYSAAGLTDLACATVGGSSAATEIASTALEQLCVALEAARAGLTLFGKIYTQKILMDALTKRLRLTDILRRFPEIRSTPVPDPIFIVAPFRTGTTFLHRLLAQDPDTRTPRIWEVAYAPPPDPDLRGSARYFTDDPRITVAETALRGLYRSSPALGRLHPMDPHLAEECLGLLETAFLSHSFMFYADVPSYLDWLDGRSAEDWRAAYETYQLQVRLLHWMFPGKRWVLKSPVHLWNLDILLDCFPDARFVQLHRDPSAVVGSFCGLLGAYRKVLTKSADPLVIGQQASSAMQKVLRRGVTARRKLGASRFIDIRFDDLIDNPLQAARTIYARIGAELTPDAEARMRLWASQQHQMQPGVGVDPAAFGLDHAAIWMDFADYSAFASG